MEQPLDLVIIGQGLAGSVLALSAQKRGMRTHVIDNNYSRSASMVAAGMWNPVSFRRIIPVWRADETMETLETWYPEMEAELEASFYHPKPVIRVFPNEAYAVLWQQRTEEGMPWVAYPESLPAGVKAPFGAGVVRRAGFVHIPRFIAATRKRLEQQNHFTQAEFKEEEVETEGELLRVNGRLTKRLVIATGTSALQLEAFRELPLRTNKGEVLDVESDVLPRDVTMNNGKWLLPYHDKVYKLGASYEWQRSDEEPTDEVKAALLEKAAAMLDVPLKVTAHRAGLRPTVKDRRALVGPLKMRGWYSFNGLGTRGVLIAPYLAEKLLDGFEREDRGEAHGIDGEISTDRYLSS